MLYAIIGLFIGAPVFTDTKLHMHARLSQVKRKSKNQLISFPEVYFFFCDNSVQWTDLYFVISSLKVARSHLGLLRICLV